MSESRETGFRGTGARELASRREVISQAALALTVFGATGCVPGPLSAREASAVHQAIAAGQTSEPYVPKAFKEHEWRLLRLLAEMIIPADEHSGSALDAGAPEFIDLLASNNQELARILTSGMLWLQHEMTSRFGSDFLQASEAQRHEMLGLLATRVVEEDPGYTSYEESLEYQRFMDYKTRVASTVLPGVRFFGWLRRLVVDAFYTSAIGIADVGYQGNRFLRRFEVPEGSIRYAIERSPFDE